MSFVYVLTYLYPKIKRNGKTYLCQSRLKLKSVMFVYCDLEVFKRYRLNDSELNKLGNGGN